MDASKSMKRGTDLSDFMRGRIYSLKFDAKWSYQEISVYLKISRNTVAKCCQRLQKSYTPEKNKRSDCGSSKITSERDVRHIVRHCEGNRFKSAVQIQKEIMPNISARTVSRRLLENGLCTYTPALKPKLTQRMKDGRSEWALNHLNWIIDDWSRITFSDESTFSLSTNAVQYVRRRIGERYNEKCILTHVNRSRGHCMIWGAFSVNDYTPLYRVKGGTLNSERYQQLLKTGLLPFIRKLLPNGGQFQQDNAPAHASRSTKKFFEFHDVNVFPWPSNSPDMSPIENVWGRMECILKRYYEVTTDSDQLFSTLEEIWNDLMSSTQYRLILIESMIDRVKTLYKVSGGYTSY